MATCAQSAAMVKGEKMIEKDLKHLTYLYRRVEKGDRIQPEDIEFLFSIQHELNQARFKLDYIRERLSHD